MWDNFSYVDAIVLRHTLSHCRAACIHIPHQLLKHHNTLHTLLCLWEVLVQVQESIYLSTLANFSHIHHSAETQLLCVLALLRVMAESLFNNSSVITGQLKEATNFRRCRKPWTLLLCILILIPSFYTMCPKDDTDCDQTCI